jgi:DNA ligase-1
MWLSNQYSFLDTEGQELLELLIKRSIGAGVGDTMILKVFPDLYFIPPYQRCSLMDAKVKDRFTKLDSFVVQRKEDGSFCYLVKEVGKAPEAITRAGSKYPTEFVEKLARGLPDGYVIIGELLVEEDGVELDRKTGNGILNSVLKGGDCSPDLSFKLSAWDCITPEEFKIGKSNQPYSQRFSDLDWVWEHIVPTKYVKTLKEAYAIYSKFTAEGKEGAILKTTDFKWASGTSKDCVKLKIEFEVDLEVVAIHEGTGKASGMMGSITLRSSDGLIVTDCGSGFSNSDRVDWWSDKDARIGSIVTIKGNDIISKRENEVKSIFLPIYLEHRLDKTVADSYYRCVEQLEAAKQGTL